MITSFVWTDQDIRKMLRSCPEIYRQVLKNHLDETWPYPNAPTDSGEVRALLRVTHQRVLGLSKHRDAQTVYQMCRGPRLGKAILEAGYELGL